MDEQNPAEVEDLAHGAGMTSGSETQESHQASLMCCIELMLVVKPDYAPVVSGYPPH